MRNMRKFAPYENFPLYGIYVPKTKWSTSSRQCTLGSMYTALTLYTPPFTNKRLPIKICIMAKSNKKNEQKWYK